MDIVAALAGNPLPTSLAVVISVAAILGYYFFVIPLMEDHKKLKQRHEELQEKFEEQATASNQEFYGQLEQVEQAIHTLKESLLEGSAESGEKLEAVEKFISEFSNFHLTFGRENESLQSQMENLLTVINRLNEGLQAHMAGAKAHDDSIDRLLTEVSRSMNNINEKQSQILGALLGMGRIQDRNRGI